MAKRKKPVLTRAYSSVKEGLLSSSPGRSASAARYEAKPVTSAIGAVGGPVGTAVGFAAGAAVSAVSRGIDQTINIATGNINPQQIIKYAIYFVIFCVIAILVIQTARGLLVVLEQIGCGFSHALGGGEVCDPSRTDTIIKSVYAFWDMEWIFRCLLYLGCAVVVAMLLYIWGVWLFDKLLQANKYTQMMEDWVFGFTWEGRAEREMEQP